MEKLMFFYDEEGDVLDVSIGKPVKAISRELGNDIVERIDPKTNKIAGFTILNLKRRFEKMKTPQALPITIKAELLPA